MIDGTSDFNPDDFRKNLQRRLKNGGLFQATNDSGNTTPNSFAELSSRQSNYSKTEDLTSQIAKFEAKPDFKSFDKLISSFQKLDINERTMYRSTLINLVDLLPDFLRGIDKIEKKQSNPTQIFLNEEYSKVSRPLRNLHEYDALYKRINNLFRETFSRDPEITSYLLHQTLETINSQAETISKKLNLEKQANTTEGIFTELEKRQKIIDATYALKAPTEMYLKYKDFEIGPISNEKQTGILNYAIDSAHKIKTLFFNNNISELIDPKTKNLLFNDYIKRLEKLSLSENIAVDLKVRFIDRLALNDLLGYKEASNFKYRLLTNAVKSINFKPSLMKTFPSNRSSNIPTYIESINKYNDPEIKSIVFQKSLETLAYFKNDNEYFINGFKKLLTNKPHEFVKELENENLDSKSELQDFKSIVLNLLDIHANEEVDNMDYKVTQNVNDIIPFLSYKDNAISESASLSLATKINKIDNIKQFNLIYKAVQENKENMSESKRDYFNFLFLDKAKSLITKLRINMSIPKAEKPYVGELNNFTNLMLDLDPERGKYLVNFSLDAIKNNTINFINFQKLRNIEQALIKKSEELNQLGHTSSSETF